MSGVNLEGRRRKNRVRVLEMGSWDERCDGIKVQMRREVNAMNAMNEKGESA